MRAKSMHCKKTRRHDFPDREAINKYYVHNLEKLAAVVGPHLAAEFSSSKGVKANWALWHNGHTRAVTHLGPGRRRRI